MALGGRDQKTAPSNPADSTDHAAIRARLRSLMLEPGNMETLRRTLKEECGHLDLSRLGDHEVIDLISPRFASGRIAMPRLPLRRAGVGVVTAGAAPEAEEEAESPARGIDTDLTWVRFKVVDDATGQPVANAQLRITLPSGNEQVKATTAEGLIDVRGIPEGSCTATSDLADARLESTRSFVGMGEPAVKDAAGGGAAASRGLVRIADIREHRVKTGESLASLAREAGLTWQQLARFNWDTDVPDEINEHLRDDVGCTHRSADGHNYRFDDSDDPGIVFMPGAWIQSGLRTGQTHVFQVTRVEMDRGVFLFSV